MSPASHSQGDAEPPALLPNNWHELAPLVDAVLDAPPERRATVLDELSAGDAARRAELERLVVECERDVPLLNRPAVERFDQLLADDAEVPLPKTLGGRYRIGRELGRGGMARVYLAHDSKHARDVAVKVIRADVAASLGRDRFLREIGIAARLRHPNIVPLYDSGDADGVLYFVMPYEEGPSLRERLSRERLSVAECVSVLRDVARALAYAHEHGVVHRDVKPDNVMLSGGAAVVTDFGIAKAVAIAQTGEHAPTLTQLGAGIGTPAYMAPEQAVGDPSTDHRADIYSFGCLAYELFAGKPPFYDLPTHQIIAAHVATKATPITEVSATVPESVARLIARCLEKIPAARPQSAQELLSSLEEAMTTGSPAVTLPPAVGWRQARAFRWAGLAVAVGVVGTAAYLALGTSSSAPPISLAVLPFGNIGADSTLEFVANGLAEEVASALARTPGIQIKSRIGARAYRGMLTIDAAEAGAKLKADYLMTGVVRQERGRWILSADLERAADATSLWDGTFNVSPDQQAGAAQAIAASLTAALRSRFPKSIGSAPVLAANQRPLNNEAYRLYLRGQAMLDRRVQSPRASAELFQEAIRHDTLYARAYSGLSMALALYPYLLRVPEKDVHDDLVNAAGRALELDPTLAQPHVALAMAYQLDYQWESATTEFQTAVRLEGRNVEALVQYARHLRFRGRHAEGLSQLRAASTEDPASALVLSQLSYAYFLVGERDSALFQSRRALQNDSADLSSQGLGALVRLGNNLPREARELANRVPGFTTSIYVIAKSGDTTTARRRLKELDALKPQPWGAETGRVMTHLGLGDTASALAALERAADRKEILGNGLFDPIFDSVRGSARFQAILGRVGLTR